MVSANTGMIGPHGDAEIIQLQFASDGMGGYITTGTDYGILNGFSLVKLHGWFMYVAWGVLGWL